MYDKPNRDCERQDDPSFCVECYAGHRADTEPRYLHIGQRVVAVTEIIDRWLDPTHRYFKLRGDDSGIYLVRHDTTKDSWELNLLDKNNGQKNRLPATWSFDE